MWSSAQITQDTEEEVQSTLRDVATQNALIVQQEIRENSPDAVNAKSIAAQLGSLSPPMSLNGLASSHRTVRQWPLTAMYKICPAEIFFQRWYAGASRYYQYSSGSNGYSELINVFSSIPAYDQSDSIIGVLFATYRNQHLKKFRRATLIIRDSVVW